MTGTRLTNSVHEALAESRKNAGVMSSLYIVNIGFIRTLARLLVGIPWSLWTLDNRYYHLKYPALVHASSIEMQGVSLIMFDI